MQLALLGSGDAELQDRLPRRPRAHPGRIGVVIGYDEALAHLIQAGADALVVPSRFEPCGLTQLCALRYGAVPIVVARRRPRGYRCRWRRRRPTGFKFAPVTADNLAAAIRRAHAAFRDKSLWHGLQHQRHVAPTSPGAVAAARYAELYREIAEMRHVTM